MAASKVESLAGSRVELTAAWKDAMKADAKAEQKVEMKVV